MTLPRLPNEHASVLPANVCARRYTRRLSHPSRLSHLAGARLCQVLEDGKVIDTSEEFVKVLLEQPHLQEKTSEHLWSALKGLVFAPRPNRRQPRTEQARADDRAAAGVPAAPSPTPSTTVAAAAAGVDDNVQAARWLAKRPSNALAAVQAAAEEGVEAERLSRRPSDAESVAAAAHTAATSEAEAASQQYAPERQDGVVMATVKAVHQQSTAASHEHPDARPAQQTAAEIVKTRPETAAPTSSAAEPPDDATAMATGNAEASAAAVTATDAAASAMSDLATDALEPAAVSSENIASATAPDAAAAAVTATNQSAPPLPSPTDPVAEPVTLPRSPSTKRSRLFWLSREEVDTSR